MEKIKQLRVRIDGLSQLVKELKSFEWITKEISQEDNINGQASPLFHVMKEHSTSNGWLGKYNSILKTDRGKYRCAYSIPEDLDRYEIDFKSKEINKCFDSLILAKAWLGKVLGELGEETPYKNNGNRKTVEDIEKTADTYRDKVLPHVAESIDKGESKFNIIGGTKDTSFDFSQFNHIKKVDWLREEISLINREFNRIWLGIPQEYCNSLHFNNIVTYLNEARFWLGFELQRIKETK